jgi:hypothetical protein
MGKNKRLSSRVNERANEQIEEIARNAVKTVEELKFSVRVLATVLADTMQKLHGGQFRVQIEHDCGLVVVAQRCARSDARIDETSLKEAI